MTSLLVAATVFRLSVDTSNLSSRPCPARRASDCLYIAVTPARSFGVAAAGLDGFGPPGFTGSAGGTNGSATGAGC